MARVGSVSERLGEVLTRCSESDTKDRVGGCMSGTDRDELQRLRVTDVVGCGLLEVSRPIQRWQYSQETEDRGSVSTGGSEVLMRDACAFGEVGCREAREVRES